MDEKIKIKLAKKDEKELASNPILKKAYTIKFGKKLKKLNIDESFFDTLLSEAQGGDIVKLIDQSENKEEFAKNIQKFLKKQRSNPYSEALLLGNITERYLMRSRSHFRLATINVEAFSKENKDLLQDLKSHFAEYIINNNKRKNLFSKKYKFGKSSLVKDLSKDLTKKDLENYFDLAIENKIDFNVFDHATIDVFSNYLLETIGRYSRKDIKDNFDFVLFDLDDKTNKSMYERKMQYMYFKGLTDNQVKKINEVDILKQRLKEIDNYQSITLLERLNNIDYDFKNNIDELEDIYLDYEILYRQNLIGSLFVPKNNITIVEDFKDIKPQLLHQFLRDIDKFKEEEYDKIKEKIIEERIDKNQTTKLSNEENKRFCMLKKQVDTNLDKYKTNYSIDNMGGVYSDAGYGNFYQSNTTNQISAQYFANETFIDSEVGIKGVGFNSKTLSPEAIIISSSSYKTTNKGLNNIEYNEMKEFEEMSASLKDLENATKSEVVLARRGIDFDTKASYIFAVIDSSNKEATKKIMNEIKDLQQKEGLKAVVYDKYQIKQSLEKNIISKKIDNTQYIDNKQDKIKIKIQKKYHIKQKSNNEIYNENERSM